MFVELFKPYMTSIILLKRVEHQYFRRDEHQTLFTGVDNQTWQAYIETLNTYYKGIIVVILSSPVAALLGLTAATKDMYHNAYNLMVAEFEPTCLVDWEMVSKKKFPKGKKRCHADKRLRHKKSLTNVSDVEATAKAAKERKDSKGKVKTSKPKPTVQLESSVFDAHLQQAASSSLFNIIRVQRFKI